MDKFLPNMMINPSERWRQVYQAQNELLGGKLKKKSKCVQEYAKGKKKGRCAIFYPNKHLPKPKPKTIRNKDGYLRLADQEIYKAAKHAIRAEMAAKSGKRKPITIKITPKEKVEKLEKKVVRLEKKLKEESSVMKPKVVRAKKPGSEYKVKKCGKSNWCNFLKDYSKKNNITYAQALMDAQKPYVEINSKGKQVRTGVSPLRYEYENWLGMTGLSPGKRFMPSDLSEVVPFSLPKERGSFLHPVQKPLPNPPIRTRESVLAQGEKPINTTSTTSTSLDPLDRFYSGRGYLGGYDDAYGYDFYDPYGGY